jgi:SAM-dependent methyltransferase
MAARANRALRGVQQSWERFGADDPLWAVLTDPDKRGGGWELGAFLATGRDDVAEVMADLDRLSICPDRRAALDFGCGVGRLTVALADHFAEVHGVDISAPMIEQARHLDAAGRCTFHLNVDPDLRRFDAQRFDLVLTLHVLQHMPPTLAASYLREMARVLAPNGVLVVHVPVRRVGHLGRLRAWTWNVGVRARQAVTGRPGMQMHVWPRSRLDPVLASVGLHVVEEALNLGEDWHAARYTIARTA